jgi:hypothetical protein
MAPRVDLAMATRVADGKMVHATAAHVRMAHRGTDLVDREIVVPMAAARAAMGADLVGFLAGRERAVRMVGLAVVDPMVLVAADQDVVNVPVSPAELAAGGALSSGWIRLTASSTKSSARLSL